MAGRKPKISDEDLLWQRYGKLFVTSVFRTEDGGRYAKVTCECGAELNLRTNDWGITTACRKCSKTNPDSVRQKSIAERIALIAKAECTDCHRPLGKLGRLRCGACIIPAGKTSKRYHNAKRLNKEWFHSIKPEDFETEAIRL